MRVDSIISDTCERHGGTFVSLSGFYAVGAFHAPHGAPVFLGQSDWFHPGDQGHAAIAAIVLASLPGYGGDYDIRPFPLPVSAVDQQDMQVRLRDAVKSSRHSDDPAFARRIQKAFALFMFGQSLTRPAVQELFGPSRKGVLEEALALVRRSRAN